jgi:hypothetical protein
MFAGLVEIGAALRSYLVLVNANREGTRFAARGRWFDTDDEVNYIFSRVVAAAGIEQRGDDLVMYLRTQPVGDLDENTTIAIHYIQVPDQIDDVGGLTVEPPIIFGPWYTGTLHLGTFGHPQRGQFRHCGDMVRTRTATETADFYRDFA